MMQSDLDSLTLPEFFAHLAARGEISRLIDLAYDEDLGRPPGDGDITSMAWGAESRRTRAVVRAREPGVVSGCAALNLLLDRFAPDVTTQILIDDGAPCPRGADLATLSGPANQILILERTLLNLLGRLCGIATLTASYVAQVKGARAQIFDTRKTAPGWRALEKYAVRCGGGRSHRLGLYDAMLIKDNHLAQIPPEHLSDHLSESIARARADRPLQFVEVEADTLDQLDLLLGLPPGLVDVVLLDNMTPEQLEEAVRRRDQRAPRMQLEASGGVSLDTVARIAQTGVERISVGAITHAARSLDVGLDVEE